jgi:hypothetical protein
MTKREVARQVLRLAKQLVAQEVFFITPLNEGQEMNYVETHRGSQSSAWKRAKDMQKGLRRLLTQGMITVMIETPEGKEITVR